MVFCSICLFLLYSKTIFWYEKVQKLSYHIFPTFTVFQLENTVTFSLKSNQCSKYKFLDPGKKDFNFFCSVYYMTAHPTNNFKQAQSNHSYFFLIVWYYIMSDVFMTWIAKKIKPIFDSHTLFVFPYWVQGLFKDIKCKKKVIVLIISSAIINIIINMSH